MNAPIGEASLRLAESRFVRDGLRGTAIAKRLIDLLICLLVAPFALLIGVPIAIRLKLEGGQVLYAQPRVGASGRQFDCLKFRSMVPDAEERFARMLADDPAAREEWSRYQKLTNDPRVTAFGRFLRGYSLDELPQFINVLRGEMSIVGPRPHAMAAKAGGIPYPDAVQFYHSRHRVKPGITGWAQVNGWRGETETVEQIVQRVEHDLYYVEHWSIPFDLWIVARTVLGGFTGRHAY